MNFVVVVLSICMSGSWWARLDANGINVFQYCVHIYAYPQSNFRPQNALNIQINNILF